MNSSVLWGLWSKASQKIDPVQLFKQEFENIYRGHGPTAVLCWGKAASRTWMAFRAARPPKLKGKHLLPGLVICPLGTAAVHGDMAFSEGARWVEAEHPLPGVGSFQAGAALLDFLSSLSDREVKNLEVFLSGGASSLAWVAPSEIDGDQLELKLKQLYEAPLSIRELNRRRSRLCVLKGGGAARWAKRLSPKTRIRVHLISDVAPFGPEVIGSGPFWDGSTPHFVAADNSVLVKEFLAQAKIEQSLEFVDQKILRPQLWNVWVQELVKNTRIALKHNHSGLIVRGGEPQVQLPSHKLKPGARGGRQSQIAAALLMAFHEEISQGRLEILCMSSDGVDGRSGSSGALLTSKRLKQRKLSSDQLSKLNQSIQQYSSANFLGQQGLLIPEKPSGTNVQDLVAILVKADSSLKSSRRKSSSS